MVLGVSGESRRYCLLWPFRATHLAPSICSKATKDFGALLVRLSTFGRTLNKCSECFLARQAHAVLYSLECFSTSACDRFVSIMDTIATQVMALAKNADEGTRKRLIGSLRDLSYSIETPDDTITRIWGGVSTNL